jgi:spore maturation protein SpmA
MVIFYIVDFAALIQFTLMILFALLTMWVGIVSVSTNASRLIEILFVRLIEPVFCCLERLSRGNAISCAYLNLHTIILLAGESPY